ncbi:MAG: acyl-CoA dehydrogenase family protein [Parvibaculaceae bacterium]
MRLEVRQPSKSREIRLHLDNNHVITSIPSAEYFNFSTRVEQSSKLAVGENETKTPATKKDTREQEEFRLYCRNWLAGNTPPMPKFIPLRSRAEISTGEQFTYYTRWQNAAYEAGLVGCDYPVAYGGGGRTKCQIVANQEMIRAKAPILPGQIGLGRAAPVLFLHGTE